MITNEQTLKIIKGILQRRPPSKRVVVMVSEGSDLINDFNFESLEVAELLIGLEELIGKELNPFKVEGQLRKVSDFTNLANS